MKSFKTKKGDEVLLNDEDYEYLIVKMDYTYCAARDKEGTIMHVQRMIPALLSNTGKQKTQYIHWDVIGHPGEMDTDHIDGNPLNNQKDNLRICSHRDNGKNRRHENVKKKYSSKYTGVSWNKRAEKWVAQIQINRKLKYLGHFINEEDAAQAYQDVCKLIK